MKVRLLNASEHMLASLQDSNREVWRFGDNFSVNFDDEFMSKIFVQFVQKETTFNVMSDGVLNF